MDFIPGHSEHGTARCVCEISMWRMPQIEHAATLRSLGVPRPSVCGWDLARGGRDRRRHVIHMLDMVGGVTQPDQRDNSADESRYQHILQRDTKHHIYLLVGCR